jgi:hypothetical protein
MRDPRIGPAGPASRGVDVEAGAGDQRVGFIELGLAADEPGEVDELPADAVDELGAQRAGQVLGAALERRAADRHVGVEVAGRREASPGAPRQGQDPAVDTVDDALDRFRRIL